MCRLFNLFLFIYIGDARLHWVDSPKDVGYIEVDLESKLFIKCDLNIGENVSRNSHIKVVTWHKYSYKKPIYRVYYSGHSEAIHWCARSNHYLAIMPNNSAPYLVIDKTIVRDTGEYRCHIRYQGREESEKFTNVKIIYPPGKPQIWHTNTGISIVKNTVPFTVGDSLNLSCKSVGGYPASTLKWFKDYVRLNSSYHRASQFKMNKHVTTTVKLISRGMKEKTIEQVLSNLSVISVPIIKGEEEPIEGHKLEGLSNDACNATNNRSFNNLQSHDEEVENETASLNFLFIFVVIGICVFTCLKII